MLARLTLSLTRQPAGRGVGRSRRGFTTVELIVVVTLGGIVAAAIATVLRRQQRFFGTAAAVVAQRVALRDATGILPAELRALAPRSGDVVAFADSALEIRATIGAAIACDTVSGGGGLVLAPVGSNATRQLAAFATTPQPGDIALVYDEGLPADTSDDTWLPREIADVTSVTNACTASPLVSPGDASMPRMRLGLSGSVAGTVRPGAYVRVVRRVRYRFYRSGTGDWYLGYSEWDGSAFGLVQPVSGPFAPYSRRGSSGLTLQYFDSAGVSLASSDDAGRIARIDVTARGAQRESLASSAKAASDSQTVSVAVRNR